ncbi:glycoside hydrolase family 43 protein [Ornithinibacillus contaminans]|uniref:glycoside hydrolase family 43 protein n=1 Tax=Ornithinibacillus contaminans TaxID=694055 RepID=UPI000AB55CA5|nr:glycoside hydrolase family 43 protein [Ornithinibacillus contaminans]
MKDTEAKKKNKRGLIIGGLAFVAVVIIGIGVMLYMDKQNHITYTNPVGGMTNIGDPFVLKDGDNYYMYATSEASYGFKVWKSDNLVDWQEVGIAYNHYDQSERWAFGDFWAPEVIKYQDRYYMTYSGRNEGDSLRIAIATSDNPLGPFEDYNTDIIEQSGSYIDGHIFMDDDGTPYLYYVKDNYENIIDGKHVSQIYVQEMSNTLDKVIGEPQLLLQPDQEWEGLDGDYQWNEGPYVLKHDDKYYLMYSANLYASAEYGVGYAVADAPLGPFKKADENPILSKDLENGISGPGHNSVTVGPDGESLYTVYHTHTYPEAPSGDRQMNIDLLYFEDGKLLIDGPTHDEQKIRIN